MAPPPATPTPHRFLVPGRSQPRPETPKPVFHPGNQQFQATPRFSLHSTPRAAAAAFTPFRPRSTGRRDVIHSSPPPSRESSYPGEGDGELHERDSVIDEDDVVRESSALREVSSGHEGDESDEHQDQAENRQPKRRRLSLSSDMEVQDPSPGSSDGREPDVEMHDTLPSSPRLQDIILDPEAAAFTDPDFLPSHKDISDLVTEDQVADLKGGFQRRSGKQPSTAQQPTFHQPPRFKPVEVPQEAFQAEPLPDAFSPRRKGTKYIPGGLASELREWLVDVEAGASSGAGSMARIVGRRDGEWVARIRVDEVRGGQGSARGMTLVTGRMVLASSDRREQEEAGQRGDGAEASSEVLATNAVRVILAGLGRLSGLGISNQLKPGVVVGIARPTWEAVLDGLGRWGVSCDWVVLD